ncbi:MAG: Rne/Rng family ribonuclease [Bdellovibrionales bacterium]
MTKSMLVDATHAEETRIAVVDNGRLADFDYESSIRQQLKGSIFLAKVTRVEPSLQAAFVNFGGNRHGFLPFNEIHPDYFRIPISDREAIIAEQKAYMDALAAEEEAADLEEEAAANGGKTEEIEAPEEPETLEEGKKDPESEEEVAEETNEDSSEESDDESNQDASQDESDDNTDEESDDETSQDDESSDDDDDKKKKGRRRRNYRGRGRGRAAMDSRKVEVVGGDIVEGEHTPRPTLRKNYKIQEVVKRGQIMLVQAQKEERGNKGAAVTSYISLPGRYCVLMPNSPRGGGVSRKIANYKERKRMREILKELNVPEGMSVILRTAGVARTKVEIKRDLDYLMRLWDDIRALTLESIAPACVYEEGNLIKRGIRDIYTRDVEEVIISGEPAFKEAKKFMKMLIPSHAKKVVEYKDDKIPLFHKYKVESQIVEMGGPEASLRSGGSIVINPTEALVAIDVNSGRATKERHIEETALKTNLEAAEEVARQLRLRDLGGLIVIDFIDMENYKNNAKVERKLKECLSGDRARIQIGRISSFGLLELSRQRLNPSMTESQFKLCDSCHGLGYTRTTDSTAVIALRTVEEQAINGKDSTITLTVNNDVALYILNNKRDLLSSIEKRHNCKISLQVDDSLAPASFLINGNPPVVVEPEEKFKKQNNKNQKNKGRNRNNNRNKNKNQQESDDDDTPNKADKADKSDHDEKSETPKEEQSEKSEEKPKKKRGRKPKAKASDNADSSESKTDSEEALEDSKKDEKPKKTRAKKKPAKADKQSPETEEASNNNEEEKPAPKNAQVKVVTASASKEEKPSEPASKDYETVNEAPKKKKKGWWSKG